jgi:hypothetical protein
MDVFLFQTEDVMVDAIIRLIPSFNKSQLAQILVMTLSACCLGEDLHTLHVMGEKQKLENNGIRY